MDSLLKQTEFDKTLKKHSINAHRNIINTLQLNIGKKCNQACSHCHVNAGPTRSEAMTIQTMDRVLSLLKLSENITAVDITGGAPELNKNFSYLITRLHELNIRIIDRCNLSVLFEKGQEKTAALLAKNQAAIIASLPCYIEANVDSQRGQHTYHKSIRALKLLNELGYGQAESDLILDLVCNPDGACLPAEQKTLESNFKNILQKQYGIVFNHLFTMTNMPISRFADTLIQSNKYDAYYNLLISSFNPVTAENIMCKKQLSISWDGEIFDCDFNQALNIPIQSGEKNVWDIKNFNDIDKNIAFANHCYGCTAGNGSSCLGALA